jgi:AraC family transcriptional regulator
MGLTVDYHRDRSCTCCTQGVIAGQGALDFDSLASDETFRPDPYSLRYLADIQDDMIRGIGQAISSELFAESSAGRMFVETSALALAARLAHAYAEPAPRGPQRLGSHRLDVIRLRRVLDYIAENLDLDITVAQLASVASQYPAC